MTTRFIPYEFLDKKRAYQIIGIPKCGTTSLRDMMKNDGFDVITSELSYYDVGKAENFDYSRRTPITVTRNPKERTISHMNFFKTTKQEAEQFSFYKAGLQMWDSLIFSLEYLKTLANFPHENKKFLTGEIIVEKNLTITEKVQTIVQFPELVDKEV